MNNNERQGNRDIIVKAVLIVAAVVALFGLIVGLSSGCATTIDDDQLRAELQHDALMVDDVARRQEERDRENICKKYTELVKRHAILKRGTGSQFDADELIELESELEKIRKMYHCEAPPEESAPPPLVRENTRRVTKPASTRITPTPPPTVTEKRERRVSVVVEDPSPTVTPVMAPPEATMPCYLHSPPPAIARGDIVEIHNQTQHPLGLRVNGLPLVIVGATPPSYVMLPAGVKVTPNLLPPGYRCYYVPYDFSSRQNVEAAMYRLNPHNGTIQVMSRGTSWYEIAYPRKYSYMINIENHWFR